MSRPHGPRISRTKKKPRRISKGRMQSRLWNASTTLPEMLLLSFSTCFPSKHLPCQKCYYFHSAPRPYGPRIFRKSMHMFPKQTLALPEMLLLSFNAPPIQAKNKQSKDTSSTNNTCCSVSRQNPSNLTKKNVKERRHVLACPATHQQRQFDCQRKC